MDLSVTAVRGLGLEPRDEAVAIDFPDGLRSNEPRQRWQQLGIGAAAAWEAAMGLADILTRGIVIEPALPEVIMRTTVLPCVLGSALAVTLLGQVLSGSQIPAPKSSLATPLKRGDVVTLEGCITAATFTDRKTRLTYRLTGVKELIQRVDSDHQGHVDAVTGTVKSERKFATERSRKGKKTTLVVGVREVTVVPSDGKELEELDPVLEVKSIEHIGGSCPAR